MESIVGGVCPWAAGGQAELVLGGFIQLLLASYCGMNSPNMWPKDRSTTLLNDTTIPEYDFIVVGSGSSGSVVARRLADENWKVLLLEAGADPAAESEVPAMSMSMQQSRSSWGYKAEKNPNYCQGMNDQQCFIHTGKTIGGSSSINNMVYTRGNKEDYNEWEKMGNSGWNYESVMKYYNKIERLQQVQNYEEVFKYYGTDGMVSIDSFRGLVPWKEVIKQAWKDSNLRIMEHANDEQQMGISEAYGTLNAGQRNSAAKGYLTELSETTSENLHVVRNAHVNKVLVCEKTKQAYGVQVKVGKKDVEVKLTKEVIISAGSLNTPKLLMLSGIGPKTHLETIGIKPIIADLPVGKNLIDHVTFPMLVKVENSLGVFSRDMIIQSVMQYLLQRTGPMATIGMMDVVGFINTKDENSPVPDVQLNHMYAPINDTLTIPDLLHGNAYSKEYAMSIVDSSRDHECLFIYPTLLKPKSRGYVELKSDDPMLPPVINTEYFKEQEDMDTMIRAIRFVEKLEKTDTFENAGLKLKEMKLEACPYEFKSDDYWKCMIKHVASSANHPVGTAKMGPKNDGNSVVDPELRVHGVKNLRVVDGSIMPNTIRGQTEVPTMMIGEKAAEMIKQTWSSAKKEEL